MADDLSRSRLNSLVAAHPMTPSGASDLLGMFSSPLNSRRLRLRWLPITSTHTDTASSTAARKGTGRGTGSSSGVCPERRGE